MRLLHIDTTLPDPALRDLVEPEVGAAALIRVDAYRAEDSLVLRCDLPGVDPDSVLITLSGRTLELRARRRSENAAGEVFLSERFCGSLYRSLELPVDVDTSSALADFDEGILTITLPIVEDVQAPLDPPDPAVAGPEWIDLERTSPTLPFPHSRK